MSSGIRTRSEGDVYHVTTRGVGRQLLFEDDADRTRMANAIRALSREQGVEVYAWCLMQNHVHLVLHAPLEAISDFMRRLKAGYALYFNKRHDRVGTLFQGRFSSKPVASDEQLMSTISYVHRNPLEADFGLDYEWSSYLEYLGSPDIATTAFVLSLFGSVEAFAAFHEAGAAAPSAVHRARLSESEAKRAMARVLGDLNPYDIRALGVGERNDILRKLKEAGLSVRQIERATSIGRGIIARA